MLSNSIRLWLWKGKERKAKRGHLKASLGLSLFSFISVPFPWALSLALIPQWRVCPRPCLSFLLLLQIHTLYCHLHVSLYTGLPRAQLIKNLPVSAGDNVRDAGSIPGLGRSPGGGHGNPPGAGLPWRRAWQFMPGESHGQRSLVGYGSYGCRVGHNWSDLARFTFSLYISLYGYIIFQCLKLKISRSKLALSLSNQLSLVASFLRKTPPSSSKAKVFKIMFGCPFLHLCV